MEHLVLSSILFAFEVAFFVTHIADSKARHRKEMDLAEALLEIDTRLKALESKDC